MAKKWTNATIDQWIAANNKRFHRVTDVTHVRQPSTTPITWQCDEDGQEWAARVDNVVGKGSGCPKCSGNEMLSVSVVSERILLRSNAVCEQIFEGSYLHSRRGTFRCLSCNDTWEALIHNVLKFGYGCPICNSNIGTPCASIDGAKFHSKLERTFWELVQPLVTSGLQIDRQVKYLPTRRLTADFYIPTIDTIVEISGTALLKRDRYRTTMIEKRAIAATLGKRHVTLTSIPEINNFITTLQEQL